VTQFLRNFFMCCEATRIRHLGYWIDIGGALHNAITIYDPDKTLDKETSDRIAEYMMMEAFIEASVVRVVVKHAKP